MSIKGTKIGQYIAIKNHEDLTYSLEKVTAILGNTYYVSNRNPLFDENGKCKSKTLLAKNFTAHPITLDIVDAIKLQDKVNSIINSFDSDVRKSLIQNPELTNKIVQFLKNNGLYQPSETDIPDNSTVKTIEFNRCQFNEAWRGDCNLIAVPNTIYCINHNDLKCRECRKVQAIKECCHTGSFVCGMPLCEKCTCNH